MLYSIRRFLVFIIIVSKFQYYIIFKIIICLNLRNKYMQNFQNLLTEAAQLKQSQLKKDRKKFQCLPEFIKSGLGYSKKFMILRKQDFQVQLHVALKFKNMGNKKYALGEYKQALHKYQEGLAIFRYMHSEVNQNIKDQDIQYHIFTPSNSVQKQTYHNIMNSLYLNICSCLTKLNCKEDAIYAADQALIINQTNPKAHYRKAQAYFKYVNRSSDDIKLGFLQLKQTFDYSNQQQKPIVLSEMQKIKNQISEQISKQKKWFKFMFDKQKISQSQSPNDGQKTQNNNFQITKQSESDANYANAKSDTDKNQQEKDSFKRFIKQASQTRKLASKKANKDENLENKNNSKQQSQKLSKTKQKLGKFCDMPSDIWLLCYQQDFIKKHGTKIYSILKIYNYTDLADQYKSILNNSIKFNNKKIQREDKKQQNNQLFKDKAQMMQIYFQWLRKHQIDSISKYIQRYNLQTEWIRKRKLQMLENKQINSQTKQENSNLTNFSGPLIRDKLTYLKILIFLIALYVFSRIFK